MTKSELIERLVGRQAHMTQRDVELAVKLLLDNVIGELADGGRVDVFEPDGSLRRSIKCSLPMVTSVCFGGADLMDLYVVTGSRGTDRHNAGTVFCTRADVAGLPLAPAAVAIG